MSNVTIAKPAYLAAASLFTIKLGSSRKHLSGVHITSCAEGGIFIIATDGPRMIVFKDAQGSTDSDYIIRVDKGLFSMIKHDAKKPERKIVINDGLLNVFDSLESATPFFIQPLNLVDGYYPDWRRIVWLIPEAYKPSCFNHEYLADFSKLFNVAYGKKSDRQMAIFSDGKSPMLVKTGHEDCFGVLAHMNDTIDSNLPFAID